MIKFDDSKIISTEGAVNLLADRISYRVMHRETQCRWGIQYRYNFVSVTLCNSANLHF